MKKLISVLILLVMTTFSFGEVEEYVLQAGDVISINVVEHAEFSGRHKIRPDGRINYPVIGEVDVANQTCAQLVKVMQGKLSSYVNNPVVSVSIESYYANKIFVIGAVAHAGEFQIYEPIDLMKALAMCGGLRNPKVKLIKIIRTDGTIVNANMTEIWGNTAKYDNKKYLLYPGDTMYVPESVTIPWAIISTILSMTSIALQIVLTINNLSSRSK
ncbi:MAG: hypothetical protein GX640_03495 [Fibrobacter sp.]|nr:hypothetical protein [Fibrobacter sp.]